MATCPTCDGEFAGDVQFCPRDGSALALPTPLVDPLVGRLLGGRYRLERRLGQGGMGTVYRALHTHMDKAVAVKVLRAEVAGDAGAVARFHREARAASRLDHEHCIRVSDFGQSDDGLLYLVMELLDGASLGDVVAREAPLGAPAAAAIAHGIALALAHAHEQRLVHRDLKPDNVFLARRWSSVPVDVAADASGRLSSARPARVVVKVLDFGLAKLAGETGGGGPSLTRAGTIFGTPEYMAPEQAEGEPLDARTDLYALGVILYELLTGELPFRANSYLGLLAKHVEEAPVPPRARRPDLDIPGGLERLVLRCLAKAPAERPESAVAVAEALLAWSDPSTLAGLLPPETPAPEPHEHRVEARGSDDERATAVAPVASEPEAAAGDGGGSPSLILGELVGAGPRRRRWWVAGAAFVLAIAAGGVALSRRAAAPSPVRAAGSEALAEARRLLDGDDLDGADRLLAAERASRDGAPLQLLLGDLALRRGNRLGALAHVHRATRLAPDDAEPHARLASLLALLGQDEAACREARLALARDPKSSLAAAAAARCHDRPPSPSMPPR